MRFIELTLYENIRFHVTKNQVHFNMNYRLNNGTALTKDQKTRVLLGDELSAFIDKVEASEFFSEKSCNSNMYFSNVF